MGSLWLSTGSFPQGVTLAFITIFNNRGGIYGTKVACCKFDETWTMQAPVDYPIKDEARNAQFSIDELSYSALLDRMENKSNQRDNKRPITGQAKKTDSISAAQLAVPLLTPLLKPLAAARQSILASNSDVANVGVFSRWSRMKR